MQGRMLQVQRKQVFTGSVRIVERLAFENLPLARGQLVALLGAPVADRLLRSLGPRVGSRRVAA